jgi:hypothetical protein
MANFDASNAGGTAPVSATSAVNTQLSLTAATATLTQGCLIDVSFSQNGAPSTTDGPVVWRIDACTTVGTAGSNPTPRPTQPGWRATGAVCGVNHSANPTGVNTVAAQYYVIGINQRASYRWMPVPGSEIYWPATNLNGIAISSSSPVASSYASTTLASVTYTE